VFSKLMCTLSAKMSWIFQDECVWGHIHSRCLGFVPGHVYGTLFRFDYLWSINQLKLFWKLVSIYQFRISCLLLNSFVYWCRSVLDLVPESKVAGCTLNHFSIMPEYFCNSHLMWLYSSGNSLPLNNAWHQG